MLMIAPRLAFRWGRLGEKERGAQVGAEQLVPLCRRRLGKWRRVERRGVVDQQVEAAESAGRVFDQRLQCIGIEQVGVEQGHRAAALGIQLGRQDLGCCGGVAVVDREIHAGGMQAAGNSSTDAVRGAGDQRDLAVESGCRIVHRACRGMGVSPL